MHEWGVSLDDITGGDVIDEPEHGEFQLVAEDTRRRRRRTSATDETVAEWAAAWERDYARKLVLPTGAAWNEVRAHCRRLRALIPEADVRDRFFAAYLRTRDSYVVEREHPIRLAITGERYVKLRRLAERSAHEHRLLMAGQSDRPLVLARTKAVFGPRFVVALLDIDGKTLLARTITAQTTAQAQTFGQGWLLQGPSAARAVGVTPA